MNNIWRLFKSDVRRLAGNTVTLIIVLGLVVLPSIFSWYNIIACWNVFDNTGNLTVAVANSDEGYKSDLIPLKVNVGEQITSELRANDQLNWVFTDEDDAIDGARAGRYYAAVVIPATFSADLMSFYTEDVEHAHITYYSNQKKSAIAPKVTDQGADRVSSEVNTVFAETVSQIALNISSALLEVADSTDTTGRMGTLAGHLGTLAGQVRDTSTTLSSYANVLASAQDLVVNSGELLAGVRASAGEAAESAHGAREAADGAVEAMGAAADSLAKAVAAASSGGADLPGAVDDAFDSANSAAEDAEAQLRAAASAYAAIGNAEAAAQLNDAADAIHEANESTQAAHSQAREFAESTQADLNELQQDYETTLKPTLDDLNAKVADLNDALARTAEQLENVSWSVAGSADSISGRIGEARGKVETAARQLAEGADAMERLSQDVTDALTSDDVELLRNVIGNDPETLAAAIAAPVQLERVAVYPVDNFGSAMSPLYTTLALWIGALLIMVTLRTHPSPRTLDELDHPTARQTFIGRFCTVALIALMQSTILSLGNLLFLGVQAVEPVLYVLCFWVAGLVFTFIIYTLVSLFANLGKALSVVLLIVQVSGGGGSFPMQLLPDFFQAVSPYLPIAHAVRAMRAAMFGVYNGDFWMEIGILLLFVVPIAILGLVLYKPLGKIVPRFIERVEQSQLM